MKKSQSDGEMGLFRWFLLQLVMITITTVFCIKVRDLAYIDSDGSVSYWSMGNTTKLTNVDIGEMALDKVYKEYFIS